MLESRLAGLTVAVDVQHLYRPSHPGDQGSVYTDAAGFHVTEAHLATVYALGLAQWFQFRGARVLTNSPARAVLVGDYWTRNAQAAAYGASVYLACHVNAGGGRYGAVEYMKDTPGGALALAIGATLPRAVPEILGCKAIALARGDRGAVCIEGFLPRCGAAVILEPFFGDTPAHRPLWASPQLAVIAAAIGDGVARWWTNTGQNQTPPA